MRRVRRPGRVAPRSRPEAKAFGSTRIAKEFFAGRYAEVVAEGFDGAGNMADEDVPFGVGALAFLGRVEDAETVFESWRDHAEPDVRTEAAARLFLGVGRARAGDFLRSRAWLVEDALARSRTTDLWARALVFQGLACHRYFTGRYRAAARHALRSLRAAHGAGFPYAQMLSTDLRGHALVQLGHLHAGTALLEQARTHAERVGFELNAHAIACSIAIYRAKFKLGPEVVSDLEALLRLRRQHDSYSERMVRTALAIQYALRGRASDAVRELERADADALRVDARRAKVATLIARLQLTRLREGARACAAILDDVAALTQKGDVAYRSELLSMGIQVARSLGDDARLARAVDALRAFRPRSEHHLATTALGAADRPDAVRDPHDAHRFFAEDEISPMLTAAAEHDASPIPRLLALGVLGPIPEMLGLAPGRRVMFLARENVALVEDHGDLFARASPPRWVMPLLRVLSGGASKEVIVRELWGIRRYSPDRHDSLVRTTIHRLRALLEPRGDWVVVTPAGYAIDAEVRIVGRAPVDREHPSHVLDMSLEDAIELHPPARPSPRVEAALDDRVLERVRLGSTSAPDVAEALGVSESTALRALRRLVKSRLVVRKGAARATRYAARQRQ